jgi:hypothetical protein
VNVSQEELKALLSYDPETGEFRWWTLSRGRRPGVIGCPTAGGYLRVRLKGQLHYLHRLAWLYVHGTWPAQHIDHVNGDARDNRIANLRDVSRSVNLQNSRKARVTNQSGLLGAHRKGNRWTSKIRVEGEYMLLGTFGTPQEAHETHLAAKRKHHEGCTL